MSEATFVTLRSALKSQYRSALSMLREDMERCPDELWGAGAHEDSFWRVVYHALFYVHFYLGRDEASFRPWEHHREGLNQLAEPDRGEPYTKDEMLAYWHHCNQMVVPAVEAQDLSDQTSGFTFYPISRIEHQIVSIRHIEYHAAQLSDRLTAVGLTGPDWAGTYRS